MLQALEIIIKAAPGFHLMGTATNGIEAVNFCAGNTPDVILMDMQMPRMNGVEATEIITTSYPGVSVLAITAFSSEEYLVPALRAGAAGYLIRIQSPPNSSGLSRQSLTAAPPSLHRCHKISLRRSAKHTIRGLPHRTA